MRSDPQVHRGVRQVTRRRDEGPDGPAAPLTGSTSPEETPRILTDRQLEILVHVARGRTNRQVGEVLGISERTVRNHLRTISRKLAASDRTHAVVLAIEHGWIPIPIEPEQPAGSEPDADQTRGARSGRR